MRVLKDYGTTYWDFAISTKPDSRNSEREINAGWLGEICSDQLMTGLSYNVVNYQIDFSFQEYCHGYTCTSSLTKSVSTVESRS